MAKGKEVSDGIELPDEKTIKGLEDVRGTSIWECLKQERDK